MMAGVFVFGPCVSTKEAVFEAYRGVAQFGSALVLGARGLLVRVQSPRLFSLLPVVFEMAVRAEHAALRHLGEDAFA